MRNLLELISNAEYVNLHSHTQFCDGHASMAEIAKAACDEGFQVWGISPHSPINIPSPCNMAFWKVPEYLDEVERLKKEYEGRMIVLGGMEIDYVNRDFGPHIPYFRQLPLDYRIGSVHFVPNQEGVPVDCDGSAERFGRYLKECFDNDLQFVVESYYSQVAQMLELGGFEIVGHFDKIAGNASVYDPEIETRSFYRECVSEVIRLIKEKGYIVEINTKAYEERGRFYPAQHLWPELAEIRERIILSSDAHWPAKVSAGIPAAKSLLPTFFH